MAAGPTREAVESVETAAEAGAGTEAEAGAGTEAEAEAGPGTEAEAEAEATRIAPRNAPAQWPSSAVDEVRTRRSGAERSGAR